MFCGCKAANTIYLKINSIYSPKPVSNADGNLGGG